MVVNGWATLPIVKEVVGVAKRVLTERSAQQALAVSLADGVRQIEKVVSTDLHKHDMLRLIAQSLHTASQCDTFMECLCAL